MPISFEVTGQSQLNAKLGAIPSSLRDSIRFTIATRLAALRSGVIENIGAMFQGITGRLKSSPIATLTDDGTTVTGEVSIDLNEIPYARIQERGGTTSPHTISPVRASVLAFMSNGGKADFSGRNVTSSTVFAKSVQHPGSRIPEHPFMRLALVRERPFFEASIRDAVGAALSR